MSTNSKQKSKPLREVIIKILRENNTFQTIDTIVKKVKEEREYSRIQDDVLKPQVSKIINEERKMANNGLLNKKRESNSESEKGFKQFSDMKDDKILEEFAFVPHINMSEIGGFTKEKFIIEEKIGKVIKNWDIIKNINSGYARTFLISGPSGCGKTTLIQSIAGEYNIAFYQIIGPQLISALSGESESKLRRLFLKLKESSLPSILFIDEIDTIIGKKDSNKEMESRISVQFKACLDGLNKKEEKVPIFVIGSTHRPDVIDINMRRSGIFDVEIEIPFPSSKERKEILVGLLKKVNSNIDEKQIEDLSERTAGYVACDLVALIRQSGLQALKRILSNEKSIENINDNENLVDENVMIESEKEKLEGNSTEENYFLNTNLNEDGTNTDIPVIHNLEYCDFINALSHVKPNSLREGFTTIPSITWNDIGGLDEIKKTLELQIVYPIKYPQVYSRIGINDACGVLLYGPPGCGKTLLAKAVANAASANFISVKGPELLNKYVGESERAIRELFKKAKNSQPCIIFFDEFDSLAPKRSSDNNSATDRVVNQLLTVTDGLESREQIFLIAATNRKDMIDEAMLRDGRLGYEIEVALPKVEDRKKILMTHTKGVIFDYDLDELSMKTDGFSGADLAGLVRQAKVNYLKRQSNEDFHCSDNRSIVILKEDIDESLRVKHMKIGN